MWDHLLSSKATTAGQPIIAGRTSQGRLLIDDGLVRFGYDENFWVRSLTLRNPGLTANLSTTTYTYDNDGLLTQASFDGQALNLTRSADNGLLQGTSFNRISDTWGYNPFAEPTSYVARFDGAPVFSAAGFVR